MKLDSMIGELHFDICIAWYRSSMKLGFYVGLVMNLFDLYGIGVGIDQLLLWKCFWRLWSIGN